MLKGGDESEYLNVHRQIALSQANVLLDCADDLLW